MIGGGSPDQRGNMENLQRDGLARIKAGDVFRLPVRQNVVESKFILHQRLK